MKKIRILMLAGLLLTPLTEANARDCYLSRLEGMVEGDTLNLEPYNCELDFRSEYTKVVSFLSEHPEIKKMYFSRYSGFIESEATDTPLKNISTVTTLSTPFHYRSDLAQALAKNTDLTELEIFGIILDSDVETILNNPSLRSFSASTRASLQFTDRVAIALANHPGLTSITLEANNNLTEDGLLTLVEKANLKHLSLSSGLRRSSYELNDKICAAIANHPALQELEIDSAQTHAGLMTIAGNTHLTRLRIAYNYLDDEMAVALSKSTHLMDLDMFTSPAITDAGIFALAQLPSLQKLKIKIGAENFSDAALAALIANPSLKELTLDARWLDDGGKIGPKAHKALIQNTSLNKLTFSKFKNGDSIAVALSKNPSVRDLTLIKSHVTSKGMRALARRGMMSRLAILGADDGAIKDEDVAALANNAHLTDFSMPQSTLGSHAAIALSNNPHILRLDLRANRIDDEGAYALAKHDTLKFLDICGNNLSEAGREALELKTNFLALCNYY